MGALASAVKRPPFKTPPFKAQSSKRQGEDAAKLDNTERTRLRTQALDWLRADLTAGRKLLDQGFSRNGAKREQKTQHW